MAGFCTYGCSGTLTVGGVLLNTPAWDVPSLTRLWIEAEVRGDNRALAGVAAGRRGNPRRYEVTEFDLAFAITGSVNSAGTPYMNDWIGLQTNLATLWSGVFSPVTTGRGTRAATLVLPSGTVRTADVQIAPLTFPNDIDDPTFVEAVIHLTVTSGRFS